MLRRSIIDACGGTDSVLDRLVKAIQAILPDTRITVHGDSGFYREELALSDDHFDAI